MPHTTPPAPGEGSAPAALTLERLLASVPTDVRAVFSTRTLRPLLSEHDRTGTLLHTLEVFLHHDASWSRTAAALHLHVNTIRYRIHRIEHLTGRDLTRLSHRLDLHAALLCRAGAAQGEGSKATQGDGAGAADDAAVRDPVSR
ncbi:PucR family transcriptional regulator [Streptomyces sp. NPDC059788]|uniref:PucR family transcriptional regulator n=1 Tax=Streptomyces sp. NPDC059788 TaxID=3346948 RepID=UPI00364DFB76